MVTTIPITLGTGSIPALGIGTHVDFGKAGTFEEMGKAVGVAIDVGYRHIDTAWLYGTQKEIGKALAQKIKEGVVKREDVFITTKLWITHHNPSLVRGELEDSLKDLQTDYVDMFLMHWPLPLQDQDYTFAPFAAMGEDGLCIPEKHKLEDVWKAMEECHKAGLTRNVGLSNCNSKQLDRIWKSCTIKPSAMEVEISPYFSNSRLRDYCFSLGMVVIGYAPFGAPWRTWAQEGEPDAFQDQNLKKIAQKKNKTIAQILVRFHLQRGLVVIPKSVHAERVRENFQVYDFSLTDDEMKAVDALDINLRTFKQPLCDCSNHPQYPFTEPF